MGISNNINQVEKIMPLNTRLPASAQSEINPIGQIDQVGQTNLIGQVEQKDHIGQIDQKDQVGQTAQKDQIDQKEARVKGEQTETISAEEAEQLTAEMNEIMDGLQTRLGFSIREDLNNQVIVEITDKETDEIIKQIPSKELLAFKEKMEEFSGLLFDQKI